MSQQEEGKQGEAYSLQPSQRNIHNTHLRKEALLLSQCKKIKSEILILPFWQTLEKKLKPKLLLTKKMKV